MSQNVIIERFSAVGPLRLRTMVKPQASGASAVLPA
jgi:hypothetical protein